MVVNTVVRPRGKSQPIEPILLLNAYRIAVNCHFRAHLEILTHGSVFRWDPRPIIVRKDAIFSENWGNRFERERSQVKGKNETFQLSSDPNPATFWARRSKTLLQPKSIGLELNLLSTGSCSQRVPQFPVDRIGDAGHAAVQQCDMDHSQMETSRCDRSESGNAGDSISAFLPRTVVDVVLDTVKCV